ncbi:cytochrome P450 2F3-like [Folsomia candida]|uniref:cytochrome P450 2F3-like n=1 Tax=Folsomia candida TaxID=158441 RepID=UPI0016055BE6|nr:cytochrome P450 2F3-like [Folsomia candida]
MITIPFIFIVALVGAVGYYVLCGRRKNKNSFELKGKFPPGPRGLPFLGNILQLSRTNPFLFPPKWAEQYGDIYSISMAGTKVYVISDFKILKDMFSQEPAFAGRFKLGGDSLITDLYTNGQLHGIINSEGKRWEELRRFTIRQLREFGFGKSTMEALIMDELKELLDWMKSTEGQVISDIKDKMTVAMVNSLWMIISGHRYKHDDPKILALSEQLAEVLELAAKGGGIVLFWPWLEKLGYKGFTAFRNYTDRMRNLLTQTVQEHKETCVTDFSRDFIDVFLKEINTCEDPSSAFFKDVGGKS